MPELPEVETFRRRIMGGAEGKVIEDARVDGIRLLPESRGDPEASLRGRRIVGSRRNGKSLFLELDDGNWLFLHFGMSGYPLFFQEDAPRFARLLLTMDEGNLAICWPRRLGAMAILDDVDSFLAAKGRGPDALDVGWEHFRRGFKGRRTVKSLLLDQSFISGVGNLYADEMLYQTGVLPTRPAEDVSEEEIRHLHSSMIRALEESLAADTEFPRLPADMMLRVRGKGGACPRCSGPWSIAKVAGRTSYFCASCQC